MAIFNNIHLRYKLTFDLNSDPKALTFTDLIASAYNTTYGFTLANIKGIVRITGPDGVIYANAGFSSNDFSSPDIDGNTSSWTKVVSLPLDSEDAVLLGDYTIEYKLSTNGTSLSNQDSYTYDFAFIDPVPSISGSFSSQYSTIVFTDTTDYAVEDVDPINDLDTDRDWTIKWPLTAGSPPPHADSTGHLETITLGPNVWTGTYIVLLEVDLNYNMILWTEGTARVVVVTSITGEFSFEAEDDSCVCAYYTCFRTIEARYQSEIQAGDFVMADRIKKQMDLIAFYFSVYTLAKTCNADAGWACDKIAEISFEEGCECATSSSTTSKEVVPWASMPGTSVSVGTKWYDGSGEPDSGLGATNDYYLDTDSGSIYKKLSGAWSVIGSLKGPSGSTASSAKLLSVTTGNYGTDAGTSEKDLISYTMDNTPTQLMPNDGDVLVISAVFTVGINDHSKTIRAYFGGDIVASLFMDSEVVTETSEIEATVEITRVSETEQFVKGYFSRAGLPGNITYEPHITIIKDLAADQIIKVTGQNGSATANDIVANSMKILYIPITA